MFIFCFIVWMCKVVGMILVLLFVVLIVLLGCISLVVFRYGVL